MRQILKRKGGGGEKGGQKSYDLLSYEYSFEIHTPYTRHHTPDNRHQTPLTSGWVGVGGEANNDKRDGKGMSEAKVDMEGWEMIEEGKKG